MVSLVKDRYSNQFVELLLPPDENWEALLNGSDEDAFVGSEDEAIEYRIEPSWGGVQLIIHDSFLRIASTPVNRCERRSALVCSAPSVRY